MSYTVKHEVNGKQWFIGRGLATWGSMEICIPIGELTGMSAEEIGQTVLALLPIAVRRLEADAREMALLQDPAYRSSPKVEKHTRQKKPGHVYVIRSDAEYKIGQTTNLESRLRAFARELPGTVEVIKVIATPDPRQLETQLHDTYADKRLVGEWFALDPTDVDAIRQIGDKT